MKCPSQQFNFTLINNSSLSLFPDSGPAANCDILQTVVCGGLLSSDQCFGICPNPDLAGVGVRVAFYLQSVVSTFLVVLSPSDSAATAWAGTLLTTSLVVAAIVQKALSESQLTLHHASLVLNLATLSCVSSLAVAPTLPIWRLNHQDYAKREHAQHALHLTGADMSRTQEVINDSVYRNAHREQSRAAQDRARLILSLAILFQVVAQWGWAIFLFVSPHYSQPECSGNTTIIMFFKQFKTQDINLLDPETGHRSFIWPGWLLFCVGIMSGLTIVLAVSSSFRANVDLPSRSSLAVGTPAALAWVHVLLESLHPWQERRRLIVFGCHFVSLFVWIMLVATSEWQTLVNDIFPGENNVTGLGQITALCVSMGPIWSLVVAMYKYPALLRRRKRNEHQHQERATSRSSSAPPRMRHPYRHAGHPSGACGTREHEMPVPMCNLAPHAYIPMSSSPLTLGTGRHAIL